MSVSVCFMIVYPSDQLFFSRRVLFVQWSGWKAGFTLTQMKAHHQTCICNAAPWDAVICDYSFQKQF